MTTAPSTAGTGPTAVTFRQPSADPNVAGPDNGPPCQVAKQYSDEPPTGMRADVIAAWKRVKQTAAATGVTLCLNDGKRSRAQQLAEFDQYAKAYGTAVARQYVLPPEKSAHVAGYAVDVQPAKANQWLQATKGKYGFCRMYTNETWHFEYSTYYIADGCPSLQAEPTY